MENSKDVEKEEVNGENDESKVSDDEALEGDVDEPGLAGEVDEINEVHAKALQETTCVKTWGFKRSGDLAKDTAAWYKFFKEDVKVEVPLIQTPGPDDQWIIFKMHSVEDKRKLVEYVKKNKFNGNKIRVKAIAQKESQRGEGPTLPEDVALDMVYPKRSVLYADQLKEKQEQIKKMIEEQILPMKNIKKYSASKKYFRSITTEEIVPLSIIDGYENNILIHIGKCNETGEVLYGMLAIDAKQGATALIPLEKCLSIPRQMASISKEIVNELVSCGLEPFDPISKDGEFLGFLLRISDQATFMLTVIIKKPEGIRFHELSPEGIVVNENDTLGESYREVMEKKMAECKEKITKFYDSRGKSLSIQSIYAVLSTEFVLQYQTTAKYNLPSAVHVAGDEFILEKLNGILIKVHWDRERHTEVVKSVLSLFDPSIFNSKTTVYLASPIKQIGYYFAKACGHVTQIGFWYKDVINKYTAEARKEGIKNIEYMNYNAKLKTSAPPHNSVVIWWPVLGATIGRKNRRLACLQQFLDQNFSHMIFISYWNKPNEHIEQHKRHMEEVYSKLRVNKIIPFDTEPYKAGFGLYISFKGFVGEHATNRLGNKNLVGFKKGGPPFRKNFRVGMRGRGQWAQERGRISVHERLGPRQPSILPPPSYNAQMERVAGVVQNLKNVTQQMQVLFNQKQGPEWSNKRRYPSDGYDRDNYYREEGWGESWVRGGPDGYGDFKRRRDGPPPRMIKDSWDRPDYDRERYGGSSSWGPPRDSSWGRGPSSSQSRNGWWGH